MDLHDKLAGLRAIAAQLVVGPNGDADRMSVWGDPKEGWPGTHGAMLVCWANGGGRSREVVVWYADDDVLLYGFDTPKNRNPSPESRRVVRDVPHLRELLGEMRERLARAVAEKKRATKVADLTARSLDAKVEALAKKHRFQFTLKKQKQSARLAVKLDESSELQVSIPLKQADEVLAELPGLIQRTVALFAARSRFKIAQASRAGTYVGGRWTRTVPTWRGLPPKADPK